MESEKPWSGKQTTLSDQYLMLRTPNLTQTIYRAPYSGQTIYQLFRTDSFTASGQWVNHRCRLELTIGWLRRRFGFPFDHFDLFWVTNESLGTCLIPRWMDLSALKVHSVDDGMVARHIQSTYSIDVLCVQTAKFIELIDFSFRHTTLRALTARTLHSQLRSR